MKFAHNGYYIEKYIKCDNCGVLIYDDGLASNQDTLQGEIFCSNWCREWREAKHRGVTSPQVTTDFST